MTAAALSTAVQTRFGSDILIQLSNSVSTATTINTTVLTAACEDAIGEFERVTTIAHDTSNASHLSVLIKGVLYFLEYYKSRDSAVSNNRGKDFFLACNGLKKGAYLDVATNSNLTVKRESSGSMSDMDKLKTIWPNNRVGSNVITGVIEP